MKSDAFQLERVSLALGVPANSKKFYVRSIIIHYKLKRRKYNTFVELYLAITLLYLVYSDVFSIDDQLYCCFIQDKLGLIQIEQLMDYSLGEQLNSMMRSVSKNIGVFDLDPQPLHTGTHGQIFHITNRNDRKSHVLKVIWKHNSTGLKDAQKSGQNYLNEKRIHQSLKNRYIVQLHNSFQDENNSYLVLQYCKQGNLRKKMNLPLTIETVRDYSLQIAKGLAYLHKNDIIHGDLKPENILVTEQNEIKICDFGVAVKCTSKQLVKKFKGTVSYAPPEAIQSHNHKLDIWSWGCIIHQMILGKLPFACSNWKELSTLITQEYLRKYSFNSSFPVQLVHLFKKIFMYDKDMRPSIEQAMSHPFFTGEPLILQLQSQKPQQKIIAKRSSSGKSIIRSVQLTKKTQQNKENDNKINLPLKNTLPDYKKLLQLKFKKQQVPVKQILIQQSLHTSGDKSKSYFKDNTRANTHQYKRPNCYTRQNTTDRPRADMSPLNTAQMVIKPLSIKHSIIEIDSTGYTRHSDSQVSSLWFNVSCEGKLIKIRSKGVQKVYKLEDLPSKYHKHYEEAKRIVRGIQSQVVRMTFTDAKGNLHMKIMYDGSAQVRLAEIDLPRLSSKDFSMSNHKSICDKDYSRIRAIYLNLINLS